MTEFLLIPAYYEKEIILTDEAINELKRYKKIALFGAVQFIKLDKVIEQLKSKNIEALTTHGKRTSGKYQLLGCDCFADSFEGKNIFENADGILYIGDGLFHPNALLLAQKNKKNPKPVFIFNPINNSFEKIGIETINKNLKKYKSNLMRYMQAEKIGILVSIKPGQQYLKNALLLKKKSGRQFFIFVDDTINFQSMENYPFIDVWVNTACPRIGFDDILNMPKPLININDAFNPEEALRRFIS